MARGDVHVELGWLHEEWDGWSLLPDDGGRWRLEPGWKSAWSFRRLRGSRVRLTGVRDGFDLLFVSRVDAADA